MTEDLAKTFIQSYSKLNEQQKQAVDTIDGPVMVVAGPGTGKTQILALRIANILRLTDSRPENILCLTFTEAGVKAMRERLIQFIGTDAYYVQIHTFHSFANELIQNNPEKFAFSKGLVHLDELTRIKIIQRIIDEDNTDDETTGLKKLKPFYDKYGKQGPIISAIQTLKKEAINPERLLEKTNRLIELHKANVQERNGKPTKKWSDQLDKYETLLELVTVYSRYQEILNEEGYYDYEDMIMFVIQKFKEDDRFLGDIQEQYLYIHVDEYQDTNGAQNEIIKYVGGFDKEPNIFVVGDDDQAIYRFQGANIENILFFGKHFENVVKIPTPVNYRSTQVILDLADSLISNNAARLVNEYEDIEKQLKAFTTSSGPKADIIEFNNGDEENSFIAREIKRLHDEEGVNYSDIAILYRKNAHASDVNEILLKFGIPTKLDITKSVFESTAVNQFIDLLKVLYFFDKTVDETLYRVLMYDFLQIRPIEVFKLCKHGRANRQSLIETLIDDVLLDGFFEEHKIDRENSNLLKFVKKLLRWHKLSSNMNFALFVERLLNESGIVDYALKEEIDEEYNFKTFNDVIALKAFYDFVKGQNQINPELNLHTFLTDLAIINTNRIKVSLPSIDSTSDAVNLMTAHSSKGLEFEYVFIIKTTSNNWGSTRGQYSILVPEVYSESGVESIGEINNKDLAMEDERRLLFVAITRAKYKIYFTFANEYMQDGTITTPSPSPFLNEINANYVERKSTKTKGNGDEEIAAKENLKITRDEFITALKPVNKLILSNEELDFLKQQLVDFKLSPTSLNLYIESPYEFMLECLVGIPRVKTKEQALGIAIHSALEQFNKLYEPERIPGLEFLVEKYEERLKKEFYGDEDYESTLDEGKRLLEGYYTEYIKSGNYIKALEVEYNFGYHNVFLELEDQEPIKLAGRIDKIELVDSETNEIKVVDYKVGTFKTRNAILGKTKSDSGKEWRQLIFYKLLSELDHNFKPRERNNIGNGKDKSDSNSNINSKSLNTKSKYNIAAVEIDYIKPDKAKFRKESFTIKTEHVEELKRLINDVMVKIRKLEFPEESNVDLGEYNFEE